MVDGTHGDWQTDDVFLARQTDERNYILVQLSIKYTNPFITLMLPSILIVLADVVSFALPLGGGERNSFKVTLVLSFTMFLIILNDQLPGDSACSPVIRTHFCICLVLLVVSMLASMVMTRLAKDGSLILCCCSPVQRKKKDDEEDKADISVVQVDGTVENTRMLRKVVNFLENLDAQTLEISATTEF
uniref:5-hydroxytryptamine receptor 3C-like n=1 Tax=Epinephelus lanceolatus TaxID=310571 RepID=UPI00144593D4|nr:5-hydroxytryptamine receptor 3C-like [Epinephelus lanceolatus]